MNCKTIKMWLLLAVVALATQSAVADFAHDTVWYKITDQTYGFWKLEFSDNDSLIAASGYNDVIFYETVTGKEIIRIPGESEVVFINNGANFIKANKEKTKLEIWDTKTFTQMDTLECLGKPGGEYIMSKDGNYLLGSIKWENITGFRIWDLKTKKIYKEKKFPVDSSVVTIGIVNPDFLCNSNNIIAQFGKTVRTPGNPDHPKYYKTYGSFTIYDFNTLDSIDSFPNSSVYFLSPNCKYIAYAKSQPKIYDFNTRELLYTFELNALNLTGLKFSSDEKYVVTSSEDGGKGLMIWDMATGKIKYKDYVQGSICTMALSHNMKYIIFDTEGAFGLLYGRYDYIDVTDTPEEAGTLYPNPTTSTYTLKYNQLANEFTTIQITDLQGNVIKPIFSGLIEQGINTYDISVNELPNGTYFVQIINEHQNLSLKLMVLK